jgi:hypothetical protein
MNWETKHYNSVLEITVSFLEIPKWDIYIGFSLALHLQCTKPMSLYLATIKPRQDDQHGIHPL